MIIDKDTASGVPSFPTVPLADSAVVRRYKAGELEIRYHRGAELTGDDVVIYSPYSMTVHYGGRYLFAVSIERDDLRTMAPMMGVPLKELQAEYGVKGFYGDPMITLYGNGEKESLGRYQGENREDEIISFLLSAVLDTFDEVAEPVEIQNAR